MASKEMERLPGLNALISPSCTCTTTSRLERSSNRKKPYRGNLVTGQGVTTVTVPANGALIFTR
jgi:hypothetical protein